MKSDLRYSATDCFETFPFPLPEALADGAPLAACAEELYKARAKLMLDREHGLTTSYNQLNDPDCLEPEVVGLRDIHVALDRAVLAAYGWDPTQSEHDALKPPGFAEPVSRAERQAAQAFEDAVLDRLFELNASRKADEVAGRGLGTSDAFRPGPAALATGDAGSVVPMGPGGKKHKGPRSRRTTGRREQVTPRSQEDRR